MKSTCGPRCSRVRVGCEDRVGADTAGATPESVASRPIGLDRLHRGMLGLSTPRGAGHPRHVLARGGKTVDLRALRPCRGRRGPTRR